MLTKGPHTLHCFYVYVHKGPIYFTLFLGVCSQRVHIPYIVSTCMFTKGPHCWAAILFVHGLVRLGICCQLAWQLAVGDFAAADNVCDVAEVSPERSRAVRATPSPVQSCSSTCAPRPVSRTTTVAGASVTGRCTKTRVKDYYCGWGKCYR